MIFLHDQRVAIVETPRTGTTFIRRMLRDNGVPHSFPRSSFGCQRHSPAGRYELPEDVEVYATMRRPDDWVKSYWQYHRPVDWAGEAPERDWSGWLHVIVFGNVGDSFAEFVDRVIGDNLLLPYFDRMVGDRATVRTEHLPFDLGAITGIGPTKIAKAGRDNVSHDHGQGWDEGRYLRFMDYAQPLMERHYVDHV